MGRLCAFLRRREPDDNIGYSILIYRMTTEDLREALSGPPVELDKTPRATQDLDRAREIEASAVRKVPPKARAHNNVGVALAACGQIEEAIAHYRKALEIEPNFAEAHDNFGVLLGQHGRFDEATAHLQQALKIKPDYAEAHNNLVTLWPGRERLPRRSFNGARRSACNRTRSLL